MDRNHDEPGHAVAVDAWLARSLDHDSSRDIARLFEAAFETIWNRALNSLGATTLTAIASRVLHDATDRYAFLSAINPRPKLDARWKAHLYDRLALVPRPELIEGLRFGLIELLTIIGRLTAEILSEDFHAALAESAPIAAAQGVSPRERALPTAVETKART